MPNDKTQRSVAINMKTIAAAALAIAAAIGGGSMLGITIEPEGTTDLRVEAAQCEVRLEFLGEIIDDCKAVVVGAKDALKRAEGAK